MTDDGNTNGLSIDQALWLRAFYKGYCRQVETMDKPSVWGMQYVASGTPANRASVSRTLRRLEQRGLILRHNDITGGKRSSPKDPVVRTTHVEFTAAGLEYMQRLTKMHRQEC